MKNKAVVGVLAGSVLELLRLYRLELNTRLLSVVVVQALHLVLVIAALHRLLLVVLLHHFRPPALFLLVVEQRLAAVLGLQAMAVLAVAVDGIRRAVLEIRLALHRHKEIMAVLGILVHLVICVEVLAAVVRRGLVLI